MGFDWPEVSGVIAKVLEELEEVKTAGSAAKKANELGDLLFSVVNLARWSDVDAETALREANARFQKRFRALETRAQLQGTSLQGMSLSAMDRIWEEIKEDESSGV